jgi:hypothetical protein
MSFINGIWEAATGYIAKVSSAGRLKVDLETDAAANGAQVGAVRLMSECDPGAVTGSPLLLSPETSLDYRLRVGSDTLLFTDTFNASAQNTALWSYVFATLTAAMPGAGTLNFSTVQGTTSAHGAHLRTFQFFPVIGTAPLALEFTVGQFVANLVSGEVFLFGQGLPGSAILEPTDGIFFRLTNAGIAGEIKYNGVTTSTGIMEDLTAFPIGDLHKLVIVVGEQEVQFWHDDVLAGSLEMPAANGQPYLGGSLPVFMQKYNTGAVSNTNQIRVSDVTVTLMDIQTFKPWAHQLAEMGQMAYQGQNGGTMGTTASLPNATAATTVTGGALSQTVAIKTGLGGEAGIQAAAAGVDGCVTAFQVPTGGINQTPRNLTITGIRIDSVNIGAAVATTASILQWSLAFGATGGTIPSLAQAESASFTTATAKAWRRIALGIQSWLVGAAIGQPAEQITVMFDSPIVVSPGQWVAVVAKFIVGTATASQVEWSTITFDAHYE